jgi:hypothetical protein
MQPALEFGDFAPTVFVSGKHFVHPFIALRNFNRKRQNPKNDPDSLCHASRLSEGWPSRKALEVLENTPIEKQLEVQIRKHAYMIEKKAKIIKGFFSK